MTVVSIIFFLLLQALAGLNADVLNIFSISELSLDDENGVESDWLTWGVAFHYAIPLAIKHFNERNGVIIPGFSTIDPSCQMNLSLANEKMYNTRSSAGTGLREFMKNIDASAHGAVVGSIYSTVTVPLSVASGALHLPILSGWATSSVLSNKNNHPTFARTTPSVVEPAIGLARMMQQMGFKRVGILYVEDEFGSAWKDTLFAELDNRGIRLFSKGYQNLNAGSELDASMDNAMSSLKWDKLNVIFFISATDAAVLAGAKSAVKLEMTARHGKMWISQGIHAYAASEVGEQAANETAQWMNGLFLIEIARAPDSRNAQLYEYYENHLAQDHLEVYFPNYTIPTASTPDLKWPTNVADFLQQVDDYSSVGDMYDAVAALGFASCLPVDEDNTLYTNLLQSDFQGVNGRVKFQPNGDREGSTLTFVLLQFTQTLEKQMAGQLVGGQGNWTFTPELFFASTQSQTPPNDVELPVHNQNFLPVWVRILGYVEVSVVTLGCVLMFAWMIRNRAHAVVVNSQPAFMFMLLVGVALTVFSIVPLTMDDEFGPVNAVGVCMAFPWAAGLGMTLIMTGLAIKEYRIALVFNNTKMHRFKRNHAENYFGLVFAVTCCEIIILIAWTVVAPLTFQRLVRFEDMYNNPYDSVAVCSSDQPSVSSAFLGVILALHGFQILALMLISLRLKDVPVRFDESRWIFLGAMAMVQIFFLGLPTTAAVYMEPVGRYLVLSNVVFLTCMAILLAMFYPKIMMFKYGEDYFKSTDSNVMLTPPATPQQQQQVWWRRRSSCCGTSHVNRKFQHEKRHRGRLGGRRNRIKS